MRSKINATSRFTGVSAHDGKWIATINIDHKEHYLGIFDTEQQASNAYQYAKRTGDYSNHNSVKEKRGTSKHPGVCKTPYGWQAYKAFNHHQYYLGLFNTELDAAQAVDSVHSLSDINKFKQK